MKKLIWALLTIVFITTTISRDSTLTSAVSLADNYSSFSIYGSLKGNTRRFCKSVSHQGNINSSDNQCKADGYINAGLQGFDYAECDVKFSSDDVPVCSHDNTFIDATTGNSITIENYTFEQLQAFDYYGGKIAKLDEIASICKKYGVGLYLDQMDPNWSGVRYDALIAVINKYRLLDNCKFIVYDRASAQAILSRCETAWIVCGQSYGSESPDSAIALADSVITDHNKVDVMLSHRLGVSAIQNAAQTMDSRYGLNIYRLDTAEEKAKFAPFATSITTNGDSYVYE